jgi:hypothetical protein
MASSKQLSYTAEDIDSFLTVVYELQNLRKEAAVKVYAATSNVIIFKNKGRVAYPFPVSAVIGIMPPRVYDADGNPIFGYRIFDVTINGFKITVSDNGFMDYSAFQI